MARSCPPALSRFSWSRRLGSLLLILGLIIGSVGAVVAQDDQPYYSDTEGPPVPGGTVSFLLYEDPDTLNPLLGQTSIAVQVSTAIIEGLTMHDPDGNFFPVLAAELPTLENGGISEDFLTITWNLRDGVRWADGEAFTASDVRFTWEAATNIEAGSLLSADYARIENVETPDDLTVVVTYSEFHAGYLDQFPWILPEHATGPIERMLEWDYNRMPIGTGPFTMAEWATGQYLMLEPNEFYREEGKPYLDGLVFRVVPDEAARTALMIQGEGHVMLWAGEEATTQIRDAGMGDERTAPGIWVMELHMNMSQPFDGDPTGSAPHPILGDPAVREAITMAIDRERINQQLLEGRVLDIDSPLSVGWMDCQVEAFAFDPEGAAAMLDAAGWRDEDGDGVREAYDVVTGAPDGTRMVLNLNGYTGFSTLDLVQLAVAEDLGNLGIEVRIENQDFSIIFGTYADGSPRKLGDHDLLIYDSGLFAEPGAQIERRYHPSQVPTEENPGGDNHNRWVREDVGEWIDNANSSPDFDVRRENFCNVAQAFREDIVSFPIFQFLEGSVYAYIMHGYTVSTWEWATWDAENWWLEQ